MDPQEPRGEILVKCVFKPIKDGILTICRLVVNTSPLESFINQSDPGLFD